MNFLIITYDEYINIPYIKKYEQSILEIGGSFDVLLWDRRGVSGIEPFNHFVFKSPTKASKISKVLPFIKWRLFALKKLKEKQYDKVILLTTIPAILLTDILLLKYKGNYLFDIRDYTYEMFLPYRWLVNLLVDQAAFTTVSSPGFLSFIKTTKNVFITHNIANEDNAEQSACAELELKKPLSIGFVGGIRYYKENIQLIKQLANKSMYQLRYVGKVHPGNDLQKYCNENNISNVAFLPAYNNAQKPEIYQNIDMINAVYGAKSPEVTLALPNKLYDCLVHKKPILVSLHTYLAQVVEEYRLGLPVDIYNDNVDLLIKKYIKHFDPNLFTEGCKQLLKVVQEQEGIVENKIKEFCKEI